MVLLHLTFLHISLQKTHIMSLPEAIFQKFLNCLGQQRTYIFWWEQRHGTFVSWTNCDAFMDHSSAWVFSKDTYPTHDMRLQVQNGCPIIFALFIGNT